MIKGKNKCLFTIIINKLHNVKLIYHFINSYIEQARNLIFFNRALTSSKDFKSWLLSYSAFFRILILRSSIDWFVCQTLTNNLGLDVKFPSCLGHDNI